MLAEKQIVLRNYLMRRRKVTIFKLDFDGFVKKGFLVIPGLFIIDQVQIDKLYCGLYSGTFDSSDFK